ncbi:MAG: aminodeoxychorismate synthase, component I [Gammaproteobacteria bacterium]|nr:MAG: aminodeoxychorismate synthase, component I [Gammaproteobacteria bacterium]
MGQAVHFGQPLALVRADSVADVDDALAELETARAGGHWLAGFASYELGYALEPRLLPLMPAARKLPLLCFGIYRAPDTPEWRTAGHDTAAFALGPFTPRWHLPRYREAFELAHALIGAGEIYQTNLTFPHDAAFGGSSRALYRRLAATQNVGYGAFLQADGLPDILCRSPELFFRTNAAGRIEARPMKGTMPRATRPETDAANRDFLKSDAKNRAENLMIVDLLRNDIGRIADIGSVRVPELFAVESYATVHQMVSGIEAQLRQGTRFSDILRALFPCGSITGAPKIRAMEVIRELEPWPREIYCGSIGWAAPDGASAFNVAIRTLLIDDDHASLSVGGGLVWDSNAAAEYEEARWKARFARIGD